MNHYIIPMDKEEMEEMHKDLVVRRSRHKVYQNKGEIIGLPEILIYSRGLSNEVPQTE
ncbi:MAG: hypothetical protein U9Q06_01410 [Nanoarchaeota archaeon]|nr:hypothetical protein [Nanoarchaeota archaeon]